jgi:hypothetical protein
MGPGQGDSRFFGGALQKLMGHLQEDAGAIARVGFATARAAVIEVAQDLQRLLHNVMGFAGLDVDQEPDAASVVFKLRIVKALLLGGTPKHAAAGGGGGSAIILSHQS